MVASVLHQKRRYLHLPILFYGTAQNKFLYLTNDLLTIIRFFLVTVNLNDMIKNQEFEFCLSIQCLQQVQGEYKKVFEAADLTLRFSMQAN